MTFFSKKVKNRNFEIFEKSVQNGRDADFTRKNGRENDFTRKNGKENDFTRKNGRENDFTRQNRKNRQKWPSR